MTSVAVAVANVTPTRYEIYEDMKMCREESGEKQLKDDGREGLMQADDEPTQGLGAEAGGLRRHELPCICHAHDVSHCHSPYTECDTRSLAVHS